MRTCVAKLTRSRLMEKDGGGTLFFIVHAGRRPEFLTPEVVPEFEGEEAWFEIERARGPVWSTWKVLRQVDAPGPVKA